MADNEPDLNSTANRNGSSQSNQRVSRDLPIGRLRCEFAGIDKRQRGHTGPVMRWACDLRVTPCELHIHSRNGFRGKTVKYVVEKTSGSRYTPHFNFLAGNGSAGISCASRGMELPATMQT